MPDAAEIRTPKNGAVYHSDRFSCVASSPSGYTETVILDLMQDHGFEPVVSTAEFMARDIETSYIVDGILPEGKDIVIAGPPKALKTTTACDLHLSIAAGDPFLDKFNVPEPKRSLFLSAESGEDTLHETFHRIAKAKGRTLADYENSFVAPWVPHVSSGDQMAILEYNLERFGAEVCFLDPLYQMLDGDSQANLSKNGQQVRKIVRTCLDRGVTPVLVDHAKKSSTNVREYKPLELEDVSGAGKAESVRSWMLINRRERFDPEHPCHKLWLTTGGSAGHCGGHAFDVDESRPSGRSGPRGYSVTVQRASEAIAEDRQEKDRQKARNAEQKEKQKIEAAVKKLRQHLPEGAHLSRNKLRERTGLNTTALGVVIDHLDGRGEIEFIDVTNEPCADYTGIRWTKNAEHLRGTKRTPQTTPDTLD